MENNRGAVDMFMKITANIRDNLNWINDQIANIEEHFDPDNLNWGDVGTLRRIDATINDSVDTIWDVFYYSEDEK